MPFADFAGRSVQRLISPSQTPLPTTIIPFYVFRNVDINGNSGNGIVAEGVIFSNGKCVMQWLHDISSVAFFNSVNDLMAIHGHNGKTVVLMWQ